MDSSQQALIDYFRSKIPIKKSDEEIILAHFKSVHLKKKEHLFIQGIRCDVIGFIISGTTRVYYLDQKGIEHVLYFGLKDWWISDIGSFYYGGNSLLGGQALEDTEILTVNPENMELLLAKVPILERLFREITQRNLAALQRRFLSTVSETADQRYQRLLERSPNIEQLVPQHQIASYLGILPESLSRMKRQLLNK